MEIERTEKNIEKINLSLKMNNNGGEKEEELELSLGLSMNGRFGVDPDDKRLKRCSSISEFLFSSKIGNVNHAGEMAFDRHAPLVRTCSLPVENEEEFRKRKEEQSARRLEARKKRLDKKNGRVINYKESSCFDEGSNSNSSNNNNNNKNNNNNNNNENGEILVKSNGSVGGVVLNGVGSNGNVVLGSQGSIGSQRSGSSCLSDLHSQQQIERKTQKADVKSPSSVRFAQVQVKQEPHVNVNGKRSNEVVKSTLINMPFVSTTTDGKRIEGFLYKYKKGEEVKIVCICHGLFLSPAEFIKHGGGGDVEHPLKHIVVSTAPMF